MRKKILQSGLVFLLLASCDQKTSDVGDIKNSEEKNTQNALKVRMAMSVSNPEKLTENEIVTTYSIKRLRAHVKDDINFGLKWMVDAKDIPAKGFVSIDKSINSIKFKSANGELISSYRYSIEHAEFDKATGFYLITQCLRTDILEKQPSGIQDFHGIVVNSLNFSNLKYIGILSHDFDTGGYNLIMYYFVIQDAPF